MIYRTVYYDDNLSIKAINALADAEYAKVKGQKMTLVQIPESMRKRHERLLIKMGESNA